MSRVTILLALLAVSVSSCIPAEAPTPEVPAASTEAPGSDTPAPSGPPDALAVPAASDEISTPTEAPPDDPEALLAEWMVLAEDPLVSMSQNRVLEITEQLSAHGDTYLIPILNVIDSPESTKEQQVLALYSLQFHVTSGMTERLIEMAETGHTPRTRGIAVQMLALTEDPALMTVFEKYAEDPEPLVQFPAILGMASLGSEAAESRLVARYFDEDAAIDEKDQIVQSLAKHPKPPQKKLFEDAAGNRFLGMYTQFIAVAALADTGDEETIAHLEAIQSESDLQDFNNLIDAVIGDIRRRIAGVPEGAVQFIPLGDDENN